MAAAVTPLVSTSRLGTDPEPTVRSLYDDGDACLNDGCVWRRWSQEEEIAGIAGVSCYGEPGEGSSGQLGVSGEKGSTQVLMQKPSNFSEPEYTVMIVHCEHDFIVADYLQLT
uniref:Uncharacterized protein n=1 Tax=Oryza glaberrima TaxID=4538 RepID=I1R2U2_ORYGL